MTRSDSGEGVPFASGGFMVRTTNELAVAAAGSQTIIDSLQEHLAVLDVNGTIVSVNAAWRRFARDNGLRTPDACVGTSYLAVCLDPVVRDGLRELLSGQRETFSIEYPCHSPDVQRWFLLSAATLVDVPGAVVSHLDITRRRLLELEARTSSEVLAEQYRALFDASRDGLALLDATTGLIVDVNPAFARLVGRDVRALEGTPREGLFPEGVSREGLRGLERQLAEPNAGPVALELKRGEGVVPTELVASSLHTAVGPRVLLTVRDTSPRVALERERERLAAAAVKAQKLELAGQLAAGIAHDMNNTLSIVSGAVDELRQAGGRAPPELVADLALSMERGRELMNALLCVGRRAPPRLEPFDAGKLVLECARMLQRVMPRTIAVRTQLEGELTALGDEGQWYQALMNLALNARNALPNGGTVVLATRRDGERITLSVSDDGVGMSEEVRARALEPFFTTREGQGTGLGLAHVSSVAEAHGSTVELQSAPGAGTTVRVSLPVAQTQREVHTPFAGRVLVVDDEPLIRRSVCRLMRELGLEPEGAGDGHEALRVLEQGPEPVLLVTDLQMPGMGGLELVRRVREQRPTLPVLVVSGMVTSAVHDELQRHAAEVLEKPFLPRELAAALERARRRLKP